MKANLLNKSLRALLTAAAALSCSGAFAAIPLAGIYEMNDCEDMNRHQMYLELDFTNSRPDFTQTFTTKKSEFRLLPADFMNAGKLAKEFKGTKAPGFGKYRHKMLVASSEEFRITNPRSKKGIILVDWEANSGEKGEAIIIRDSDSTLVTYGLTTFDRLIGPDGHKLLLVKNLLPERVKPATTSADGELVKEIITICTYPGKVPEAIKRLKELPDDDAVPTAPAKPAKPATPATPATPAKPKSNAKPDMPVNSAPSTAIPKASTATPRDTVARETDKVFSALVSNDNAVWRGSMNMAKMGRNGVITASATFSDGGKGTVVMNMKQDIAPGDCKVYSFEYLYYGKVVGETVVFDKIAVTKRSNVAVRNPQIKPIPRNEPNVIKLLSPTSFDFFGIKFTKTK